MITVCHIIIRTTITQEEKYTLKEDQAAKQLLQGPITVSEEMLTMVLLITEVSETATDRTIIRDRIAMVSGISSRIRRSLKTMAGLETIPAIPIIRITEDSGIIQDQEISRRLPRITTTGTPTEVVLDKTIINNETDS